MKHEKKALKSSRRGAPGKRRQRITTEIEQQIIIAIKSGGGVPYAAHAIGITPRAIYALVQRSPRFRGEYEDARQYRTDTVVKALYRRAVAARGSDTAAIFLLKNWAPAEYRDRHEYAVEGLEALIERSLGVQPAAPPDAAPAAPAGAAGTGEPAAGELPKPS